MKPVPQLAKSTNTKFPAEKYRSSVDIEREALRTRKALGYSPEQPLPSLPLFEALPQLRTGRRGEYAVDYAVDELPFGVEGETKCQVELRQVVIVLSEETYLGLEHGHPRARFSLAHEIGHAVQHYSELAKLSRLPHSKIALLRGNSADLPPYAEVEWQANAFAGAFLIPAAALWQAEGYGSLDIEDLCARFGVSRTCMEIRVRTYENKRRELILVKEK